MDTELAAYERHLSEHGGGGRLARLSPGFGGLGSECRRPLRSVHNNAFFFSNSRIVVVSHQCCEHSSTYLQLPVS